MSLTPVAGDRPTISDLVRGPAGNQFTVTFGPSQVLPDHRNASRILITVTKGDGELTIADDGPRALRAGSCVQLDPDVPHALAAGPDGMVVEVLLVAACCPSC